MNPLDSTPNKKNIASSWTTNPNILLLGSGILLGLTFPLAKIASEAQIPGTYWVMLHSLGASIALLVLLLVNRTWSLPKLTQLKYIAIAGPVTFSGPSLLVYLVVPHIGAGYAGIMFALSPICTAILAYFFGIRSHGRLRYIGICLGLIGAVGISLSRGESSETSSTHWLLLGLAIPIALAAGNIYRSLDWPKNSPTELLAFWSHVVAFSVYFLLSVLTTSSSLWFIIQEQPWLVCSQLLTGAMIAPFVFRLQRYGGPVTFSQIGYVSAATSLLLATIFLGERYPLLTWMSALTITFGITLTIVANNNENPPQTQ